MGKTDNEPSAELLVAADNAATQAKVDGGGDIAVFTARRDAFAARETADNLIAMTVRDSELAIADIYAKSGREGTANRKRENAERDYLAAVKANGQTFSNALALFAADNNFLAMVDSDTMRAAFGYRIESSVSKLLGNVDNAIKAGLDEILLPVGNTMRLADWATNLRAILANAVKLAEATTETTDTTDDATVTETVEETATA